MPKDNLTVFANYFIDTNERFLRLKDSFKSMSFVSSAHYIVNIRGKYSESVSKYLKANIKNLSIFMLESELGWLYDSNRISELIKTPYVIIWIEDQICMAPKSINDVVDEMEFCDADILTYTFWCNGSFKKRYSNVPQNSLNKITYFDHTIDNNFDVQNNKYGMESYLISGPSIIKTSFFKKILQKGEDGSNWPIKTPFNFEKQPYAIKWLPLRRANPKFELFASIDDDQTLPGSSLQNRGLYPIRRGAESYAQNTENKYIKYLKTKAVFIKSFISPFSILSIFKIPIKYQLEYVKNCLIKFDKNSKSEVCHKVFVYIDSEEKRYKEVFEFSSGDLTNYWLSSSMNIASVECKSGKYKKIKCNLFESYDCQLIEPKPILHANSPSISDNKYSSKNFKGYIFDKYVKSIDKFGNETLDIIVVNPPLLLGCIIHAIPKVRKGGVIVITGIDYSDYIDQILEYLNGWEKKIIRGVACEPPYLKESIVFKKV